MSVTAAKLTVDVNANTSAAERDLKGMGDTVDSSGKRFGGMGDAAKKMGGGLLFAAGAGLTMGVKTASGLQQADIAFTTMLGSGQKADAFLADLKDFAASTPFEFPDLVSASQKLLAMGFTAKEVRPTLTAIGDAVAGLGGGPEMVDRVTMALGQMQAKGKVSSEELLQLTEAGIPALKILADSYGVTTAEMQDMVTKGKVLSDKAIPAIVTGLEKGTKSTTGFGGMMEKQSKSMAGSWSTFMDTLQMGLADSVQPLIPIISEALPQAADAMGSALKRVVPVFASIVEGVSAFVKGWSEGSAGVEGSGLSGFLGSLATVIQPLAAGFLDVARAIAGGLVVAVQGLMAVLGPVLRFLGQHPAVLRSIGIVVTTLLVPALLVAVKTWAMTQVAAVKAGAASVKASIMTVAGWVKSAAAATASGATTARIWLMYRVEALKAAAASTAAGIKIAASWVAMQVKAMASAVKMGLAWTIGVIQGAAKAAASMAIAAAKVVAGWVLMGVQSMIQAVKMAAAWVIAMGPIGWIIIAVVALGVLIWKNWDKIKAWTIAAWTAVVAWLKQAWVNIKAAVGSAVSWVGARISAVWNGIKSATSAIWNGIKSVISSVWNGIRSAISTAVSFVRGVISRGFSLIVTVVRTYVNLWKSVITTVWSGIKSVVSAGVNFVRSTISRVFNAVKSFVTTSVNGWKSAISTAWNSIKTLVTTAVNGVKNAVSTGFNSVKTFITNAMNAAKTIVTNAWNGIKTAVTNAVSNLMGTVKALPGKIKGALSGLGSLLLSSGKSIVQGLIDGIKSMATGPANAIKDVVSKARDYLPFSPAKKGPLSGKGWTLYSGRAVARDFAKGITDGQGGVVQAASAMAASARATNLKGQAADLRRQAASLRAQAAHKMAASRKDVGKSYTLGDIPMSTWNRLMDQGWRGRAGDGEERIYAPGVNQALVAQARALRQEATKRMQASVRMDRAASQMARQASEVKRQQVAVVKAVARKEKRVGPEVKVSSVPSLKYGSGTVKGDAGGKAEPSAEMTGNVHNGHNFQFITYNPLTEAQSVTTNKALDRVAALPMG